MAAHAYWRILITAVNGGAVASINELRMYDAAGNYLCTGGTASASSNYGSDVAANAFDANYSNFWASGAVPSSGSPEWLRYQFASPVDVAFIALYPRSPSGQEPTTFKFQYSDNGTDWSDAAGPYTVDWNFVAARKVRGFAIAAPAAGQGYAWRISNMSPQSGGAVAIAELEFRATAGGSSLCSGGDAVAVDSGWGAETNAFDGDAGTFWATSIIPAWLGYLFASPQSVAQVSVKVRSDGSFYSQGPASFDLQRSNDGGATWETVQSFTPTWTTPGQGQAFNVTPPPSGTVQPILMIIC